MNIDNNHKINIYAGIGDLPVLSNLSRCNFIFQGKSFSSVEQAYMYHKAMMFKDYRTASRIMETNSTKEAKRLGSKIENFREFYWNHKAYDIMKTLIRVSLDQNYRKRKALLDTGNALLTHIPEKSRWLTDFPQILMELRHELKR